MVTFTFDERDLHLFDASTERNVMLPDAGAPADAARPEAATRQSPDAPRDLSMSHS